MQIARALPESGALKGENMSEKKPSAETPALGDLYCTREDLCKRLRVGKTTIWRWQKERGFPAPKALGAKAVRYRLADVDQWLAQQR